MIIYSNIVINNNDNNNNNNNRNDNNNSNNSRYNFREKSITMTALRCPAKHSVIITHFIMPETQQSIFVITFSPYL